MAKALGIENSNIESLKTEALAELCAKKMELEPTSSEHWPHVQQLGDSLRCTIECPDVQSMLRSWRRLRAVFRIRKGRGRLKNNLLANNKPPDMLVNLSFTPDIGMDMMAECQIHLRPLHVLKQEHHFFYEIFRAGRIQELR